MDDLMFGANEMSICKQDLILQEELNCETSISVREAASQQSLSGGQGFYRKYKESKLLLFLRFVNHLIIVVFWLIYMYVLFLSPS
jgi:hypothetical protein